MASTRSITCRICVLRNAAHLLVLVLEGEVGEDGAQGGGEQREAARLRAGQVAQQRLRRPGEILSKLVGGLNGALWAGQGQADRRQAASARGNSSHSINPLCKTSI